MRRRSKAKRSTKVVAVIKFAKIPDLASQIDGDEGIVQERNRDEEYDPPIDGIFMYEVLVCEIPACGTHEQA